MFLPLFSAKSFLMFRIWNYNLYAFIIFTVFVNSDKFENYANHSLVCGTSKDFSKTNRISRVLSL